MGMQSMTLHEHGWRVARILGPLERLCRAGQGAKQMKQKLMEESFEQQAMRSRSRSMPKWRLDKKRATRPAWIDRK